MPERIFLDTNALRALNFQEIRLLLGACRSGLISISVCEPVILERATQYFEDSIEKLIVPIKLGIILTWFHKTFEINNVDIVRANDIYTEAAENLVNDEKTYFSDAIENDLMDALILSIAIDTVPQEGTIILCQEKKLTKEFEELGYIVSNDPKKIVEELLIGNDVEMCPLPEMSGINEISPDLLEYLKKADKKTLSKLEEELHVLPVTEANLLEKLDELNDIDNTIVKRILGYSKWFEPLSKKNLSEMMDGLHTEELLTNISERLCIEGLIIDTGNNLLPNNENDEYREVCEQAMLSVADEILERLEGNENGA